MTPFNAFQLFMAIKQHFTNPQYDYFLYNGKVNATLDSFNRRKDKYQFAKLARHKDPLNYLVSNFIDSSFSGWVGDLFTEETENNYTQYTKKHQSLTYIFKSDIDLLEDNFVSKFKVRNGQHPQLLVLYKQNKINLETLVILNDILKFFPFWDEKIQDTIIWPGIKQRCIKYRPFIDYDRAKIKPIVTGLVG